MPITFTRCGATLLKLNSNQKPINPYIVYHDTRLYVCMPFPVIQKRENRASRLVDMLQATVDTGLSKIMHSR